MKIALLAPAGAMHRHNGLFARALHYAPLTLTTLAGLVPPELDAEIEIYDETVEPIPADLDADLVGITAITGTSVRCYRWADYYRSRGATVVLGGVHPTLVPEEAMLHANAVVIGHAEQSWPDSFATTVAAPCARSTARDPTSHWTAAPTPAATCSSAPSTSPPTASRQREAARIAARSASSRRRTATAS